MIHSNLKFCAALLGSALFAFASSTSCGNFQWDSARRPGFLPVDASDTGDNGLDVDGSGTGASADASVSAPKGDGGYGGGGSLLGDGGITTSSLAFEPTDITLTVGNTPQVAQYVLKATLSDGSVVHVAPQTAIFTRPDLATLQVGDPVKLAASGQSAGSGTLQGIYGGHVATAKLHVTVHLSTTGMGVDPSAPGALDGATAADPAVTALLYPYDKTVFPLGVTSPLVMWNAPQAGDVYRLRYEEMGFICDDYEVVTPPAQIRVAQDCWQWMTSSNGGDPVTVTLSRWDATTKTAYVSVKETWPIAPESVQGAIYYWSIAPGGATAQLSRLHPGTGAQPEVLLGGNCMACHAVSADGSTLVAVLGDIGTPSPLYPNENTAASPQSYCTGNNTSCQENVLDDGRAWFSFDLPSVTLRYQSSMFGGNLAVTPDGKYTAFGDVTLYLGDTTTGKVFPNSGLDNVALDPGMKGLMMPAFSPKGHHFVAIEGVGEPGEGESFITLAGGKLLQLDFNEATQTFSNPKGLALESSFPANQQAIAYPSYAPDENSIAFHVGDTPTGCEKSCTLGEKSIGAIYLQKTDGSAPIRLTTLTDTSPLPADQNLTFEPTFNPVERGGYFWVVVSSERNWGNSLVDTPKNGKKRLWVAAIDPVIGTTDPSHPPFYVEEQDEKMSNMRGFWALAACLPTQGICSGGFQCCSGYCGQGMCVDIGTTICSAVGDTCTTSADCCNTPLVQCMSGVCGSSVQ